MSIAEFLERLPNARRNGNGWSARCPAHDDAHASLSIGAGDDGTILVKCHAGCDTGNIVKAMDLGLRDLFPPGKNGHVNGNGKWHLGEIVATYDYRDEAGKLLYQVCRFVPKDFRQRRPDGAGGWIWKLGNVRRVLYRLPELLAADSTAPVFIVEGEKDVDNLRRLGLVATCNIGGAGKWRNDYSEALRNRHVVILPDADEPGRKHAQDVARQLHGVAASVKVMEMNLAKDASEVIDRQREDGHDDSEIARYFLDSAETTPLFEPTAAQQSNTPAAPEAQAPEAALLTDLGNGQRFAREHGDIVRFVHPWGKWLIWDGTRWRIDDAGRAMALAKETVVKMFVWAKQQIELLSKDESEEAAIRAKRIKAVLDFALKSQHVNRLKAMLDLAQSEPGIPILPDVLDRDPMLLNVANGTLDLRTGELRSHRQEDYLTKLCPVAYDADAECPIFEATVFGIFASDGELIEHVMRFFGYCMTGEVRDDIFAILHGNGSNGKSLLLKIILDVLGSDYGGTVPPELLMDMHGDSHPTLKADLFGKRLMVAFETGDGAKLNESRIKAITSIDDQKARRMREDYWSFKPTHKLLLCTNHKPRITGDDHGIWRRIALWPFNQKFWDADKGETGPAELRADKTLKDKLQAERAGILVWLVRGCLAWQRDGVRVPRVVLDATAEYRSNEDRLGSFLSERCELNREFRAKSSEVYGAYKAWADANGERPMTRTAFGLALRERGIELDTGRRWYLGLALSADE